MAKPELSVAKFLTTKYEKKLFFGAPNPLIVLEDLAYNLELEEV